MDESPKKHASTLLVIVAFATVYIVWGSTYFFIQIGVREIPPMIFGSLRFLTAGAIMLAWCFFRGEGVGTRNQIKIAGITGLLMLVGGTGAVIWAEKWLPSSLVAILISTAPFWFVILDFPKLKENLTSRSILAGLFFGFIGVLMMFGEKMNDFLRFSGNAKEIIGLGIIMFGTMSWTAGSLISKYHASGSTNVSAAWQMLAAGVAFILSSLLLGEWKDFDLQSVSTGAWLSVLYLITFGSLAAFTAYVWLLKVRPAAQVSTYAYVNPLIAVLLGVVFAGEHLTMLQVGGLVVILASVLAINLGKMKKMK